MATRLALPFHAAPDLLDRFSRTGHERARIGRDQHELAALEDSMLADIGVGRAEVEQERARPFWQPIAGDRPGGQPERAAGCLAQA